MSEFHFIEPLWFLALIPLGLLLWLGWRADAAGAAWRRVIDPRLLAVLTLGSSAGGGRLPLLLLATGWLLAVIALANPTFERQPVPAFRSDAARVVVLDLSRSMLAEDLTPSRLERARYKVADILSRSKDGQVGLVVFAGEAFAVSPLTDDAETIRAMLEALSPQLMPVQGSRPDRGIELGMDLLRRAGARNGEVMLLSDDAGGARALEAAERLRNAGHRLGVIGVGTAEGAPVPGVSTANGPVLSQLDIPALEALAGAGAGRYATLSSTGRDLDQALIDPSDRPRLVSERDPMLAERWYELGPWLAVLLLPLAALAFRRGWMMALLLALGPGSLLLPEPALAFGWADLWQRQDQQAAEALAAGELEQARALARAPARAGSAAYRLGDYQEAAQWFGAGDGAIDHYNRGNALARAGELEAALAAYDEALARAPTLEDARYNREQVEAALQSQQQQPNQPPSQPPEQETEQPQDQSQDKSQGESQNQHPEQSAGQPEDQSNQQSEQQPGGQQGQAGGSRDVTDGDQADGDQADEQHQRDAAASSQPEQQDGQPSSSDQQAGDEASAAQQRRDRSESPDGTDESLDSSQAENAQADATDGTRSEQAAADYREEAASAQAGLGDEGLEQRSPADDQQALADAAAALDPQEREARQAAEQWLRRIPDDPAELLRRKFLYQYQTREGGMDRPSAGQPW